MAAASPYRIQGERPSWVEPPPPVALTVHAAAPVKATARPVDPELDGISCAVEQHSWLDLDESLGLEGRVQPPVARTWTANDTRWTAVAVAIGLGILAVVYVLAFSYR